MAGAIDTNLVGELVAPDGARHPLESAVTLVGTGPACDITLPGLADLHCVLTNTPAGAVLRSWHPADTLVNGEPTAARVLVTGDELTLGATRLAFVWHWDDLVPLVPEPPEATVAERIDARHRQIAGMTDDLRAAREELRQERLAAPGQARADRRERARLQTEARRDRARAKRLARRFVARLKQRHAAEQDMLVAGRADLARAEAKFAADQGRVATAADDLAAREARLADGWATLAAEQERFHADRAAALVPLELAPVQPATVGLAVTAPDRRPGALAVEVEELERRAAHAAAVLAKLEEDRAVLEAVDAPVSDGVWLDAVPLDRDAGAVLRSLAEQDLALTSERTTLAAAKAELARRAAELYDQQSVVADQLAAVLVARRGWHLAEAQTVQELESIAHALADREAELAAREQQLKRLDADRLGRAQDLWKLRLKLEAWQGTLVTHEAKAAADRARLGADLDAKRGHLERWEASLTGLTREWASVRRQEVARFRDELDGLAAARSRHRLAVADLDEVRDRLHADLAAAGAATMAAGEVHARLVAGPRGTSAARQLRVVRKRYEQHFTRFRREIDARRDALATDTAAADATLKSLHATLIAAQEREHEIAAVDARGAAERLSLARELDARSAAVTAELAKAAQAGEELAAVRAEVERLAGLLTTAPAAPPTLRLAA